MTEKMISFGLKTLGHSSEKKVEKFSFMAIRHLTTLVRRNLHGDI